MAPGGAYVSPPASVGGWVGWPHEDVRLYMENLELSGNIGFPERVSKAEHGGGGTG